MLFSHYTIFPKYRLHLVVTFLFQIVHLGTFHNPRLTAILNSSDVFPMDWPGHVLFLPSLAWPFVKSELISKLHGGYVVSLMTFLFLFIAIIPGYWLDFHMLWKILRLFSDFPAPPRLVISFPNNWDIYLAMSNILFPLFLPKLPYHSVQPGRKNEGQGKSFPYPLFHLLKAKRDEGKSKFTEAWFSTDYSPLILL